MIFPFVSQTVTSRSLNPGKAVDDPESYARQKREALSDYVYCRRLNGGRCKRDLQQALEEIEDLAQGEVDLVEEVNNRRKRSMARPQRLPQVGIRKRRALADALGRVRIDERVKKQWEKPKGCGGGGGRRLC